MFLVPLKKKKGKLVLLNKKEEITIKEQLLTLPSTLDKKVIDINNRSMMLPYNVSKSLYESMNQKIIENALYPHQTQQKYFEQ